MEDSIMAITKSQPRTRALVPFTSKLAPDFDRFHDTVRRLFDDPFGADLLAPELRVFPPAEITETAEEFMVTAETPGMTRDDLQIDFEKGILTIRGEKEDKQEQKDRRYHLVERAYGSFQRSFSFPGSVDSEKLTADFSDGILTVHLPKTADAKSNGRRIEISDGKTKTK
jgi:HSP20 family protein